MNTKTCFLMGLVLLAGCQNDRTAARPGPYVRPGLVMIPADQAYLYNLSGKPSRAAGESEPSRFAATDVRSVQTESPVTAIQFNRYADPARPNELMHEAHIVYRREAPPRWRLHPASAEQQILVGPSVTDGRGEVRPLASQELDAYLREQRANLQKQQEVMLQVTDQIRRLGEQQQQLAKELVDLQGGSDSDAATEGPEDISTPDLEAEPPSPPAL